MKKTVPISYTALDTETYHGKAFLLASANRVFRLTSWQSTIDSLTSFDASNKFVFYNLDYDVCAMLRHLPSAVWKKLFVESAVSYKHFYLRYFSGKYFAIYDAKLQRQFEMYDLFPFFQRSLDSALKDFGFSQRKMQSFVYNGKRIYIKDIIKNLSPEIYRKYQTHIDRYAMQDSAGLQALTDASISAIQSIGLSLSDIFSPGYVAKKFLHKNKIKFGTLPSRYHSFVKKCYYGARIEVAQRGTFLQAWESDIKSAYPAAICRMPDFAGARYSFDKKIRGKYFFVSARVFMPPAKFYPLPYRSKNRITFPRYTGQMAYMTSLEYRELKKIRGVKIEIDQVLNIACKDNRPYRRIIQQLFRLRKGDGIAGLFYKLILNSCYGITAEKNFNYIHMPLSDAAITYAVNATRARYSRFLESQAMLCPKSRYYFLKKCDCTICNSTRRVMRFRPRLRQEIHAFSGDTYYRRKEVQGRMQNLSLAAFITADCRCTVWRAIRRAPAKIISCFTDGIFSTVKLRLQYGTKLGQWECKPPHALTVLGSGVYQFGDKTKFRGFRTKLKLVKLLREQRNSRVIKVPSTKRLSGMLAVKVNTDQVDFNEIYEDEKTLDLNFDQKRKWMRAFKNGQDALHSIINSEPLSL